MIRLRQHFRWVPIASLRTAASGKPFRPLARYTLINSPPPAKQLSITRILAVVRVRKCRGFPLAAPDFLPGSLGMLPEIGIPISEVTIDCRLCDIHRLVIAVVDNRTRHATEDRLDHIQELSGCR